MENISFIYFKSKRIFFLNCDGCPEQGLKDVFIRAEKDLGLQSDKNLLILINLANNVFGESTMEKLDNFGKFISKYSEKIAIVGMGGLKKVFFEDTLKSEHKPFLFFDDLEKAKNWLASEG
jgi:hypothetical protein